MAWRNFKSATYPLMHRAFIRSPEDTLRKLHYLRRHPIINATKMHAHLSYKLKDDN